MKPSTWRLIKSGSARGAWNMALDEAIFESASRGQVPPTLRLYAWEPPCLSLGIAQPAADVDASALRENHWELVRRPTGGRAILHTDELTYAVMAPLSEPVLAGTVMESYQRISSALLAALNLLSLPARADKETPLPKGIPPRGPVCFEVPSSYEITVDGKKLIGSAQARRREGVLQHGSLPLSGDLARITCALAYPDESARQESAARLLNRAVTVETALGRPVSWEEAADALATAFRQVFDLDLQPTGLTLEEEQRAAALMSEKYANPSWTYRF